MIGLISSEGDGPTMPRRLTSSGEAAYFFFIVSTVKLANEAGAANDGVPEPGDGDPCGGCEGLQIAGSWREAQVTGAADETPRMKPFG